MGVLASGRRVGPADDLPVAGLVGEPVSRSVDVMVQLGDPAIRAAQQATRAIPIVGMADDIVGSRLVINLKTAKALGLTIPPSLLLWADQVTDRVIMSGALTRAAMKMDRRRDFTSWP